MEEAALLCSSGSRVCTARAGASSRVQFLGFIIFSTWGLQAAAACCSILNQAALAFLCLRMACGGQAGGVEEAAPGCRGGACQEGAVADTDVAGAGVVGVAIEVHDLHIHEVVDDGVAGEAVVVVNDGEDMDAGDAAVAAGE